MFSAPLLAVLALAEPSAAPAPAPAPTPAPQPYGNEGYQPPPPGYQPPPPGYQPPPPGYQPPPYGYPPPGYYYPPPPPPQEPPPKPRVRGKGMMIAGWSIFGGTWVSSIVIGAAYLDSTTANGHRMGNALFVPVVGPFLAASRADADGYTSETETMAFAFLGLAQSAGLALGIAGTVLYAKDRRAQRMTAQGLHLGRGAYLRAGPRFGGAMLNLSLRF